MNIMSDYIAGCITALLLIQPCINDSIGTLNHRFILAMYTPIFNFSYAV